MKTRNAKKNMVSQNGQQKHWMLATFCLPGCSSAPNIYVPLDLVFGSNSYPFQKILQHPQHGKGLEKIHPFAFWSFVLVLFTNHRMPDHRQRSFTTPAWCAYHRTFPWWWCGRFTGCFVEGLLAVSPFAGSLTVSLLNRKFTITPRDFCWYFLTKRKGMEGLSACLKSMCPMFEKAYVNATPLQTLQEVNFG